MARKCFLTFHYKPDCWRVGQIKNIGSIEDQPILTTNEWEEVKKKGEAGIKKWIDDNMYGKSCQIVLIGANTYGREWVNYEIDKAWKDKGLLAIHIHNMKDSSGNQSTKGKNPYGYFTIGSDKKPMTDWVKTVDPPYTDRRPLRATFQQDDNVAIREPVPKFRLNIGCRRNAPSIKKHIESATVECFVELHRDRRRLCATIANMGAA